MERLVTKALKRLAVPAVLALTLGAALPAQAASASNWVPRAALPTPLEGHCTAVIGDKILTAYGFSPIGGDTNGLRVFDIAKNAWSLGPSAPLPAHSEGYRGVSHGGKLFCIGGRGPWGAPHTLELSLPATSNLTSLASIPDASSATKATGFGGRRLALGESKTT